MSRALLAAWALVGLGSLTSSPAQQPAAPAPSALPVPPEQVVSHASQTVDWYRHIVSLEQLPTDPEDVITRDRLYQTALTTVELAFDFGRAAAVLAAAPTSQGQSGASGSKAGSGQNTVSGQNAVPGQNAASGQNAPSGQNAAGANSTTAGNTGGESASLDRAAARLTARVAALQAQLNDLDQQIAQAPRKERDTLTAQRGEVSAALALTREIQDTVTQIERFEESSDTSGGVGASGLAAQIRDLQRSVPEARRPSGAHAAAVLAPAASGSGTESSSSKTSSPPAASSAPTSNAASSATAAAAAFRPESAGVIALTGEWFSLASTRRQLNATAKQTDALLKELESLRTTVTHDVRTIAQQNLAVTSSDAAQIAQAREELDSAAMRFRQLSTLLIPLGEQAISLESARNALSEWRNSLQSRSASVARYLLLRISVLLGSVVIVLIISDVWRRATFRYLHDSRRRMQFLALRRVVVSVALALVIIFGLVSEVGSVATYAGLITAGLAVALQNVILAVVAYFFLIGRYGVRVGDRITLAGVTGRVVEIGLIRIYLMELTGPELRSSGRMVVLSNAVLFQPTALFKQMPGGDYFWHAILMTLAPATDVQLAQTRLGEAADSVYEHYRPAIEQQHAALQRFIDFETAMPRPEVYLQLSEKGLECTVRYPVETARSASIDQKMLSALREARAKAPELQLVAGPFLHTT